MGRLLLKVLKRAHEEQSEPLSQPCTDTVHNERAVLFSKPRGHSFRAAARKKRVTF